MVREVRGERFYHINRLLPYAPQPLWSVGQHLHVGTAENPFFQFYRSHIRRYSVTQPNGTMNQVPAIAFLRQVRDGNIRPNELAKDAFEIAQHFMMLARELLWETVRLAEFSDRPSRQRAVWLVGDIANLAHWQHRLQGGQTEKFQFVEVRATGRVHECDAALLLGDSESLDESECKAHAYWRGDMLSAGSEPEVLFDGCIEVTRILERLSMASG